MAGRNFLFVPGPTNIPDRVQRAMVIAMEDHRSSKFPELALAVLAELKQVFKTQTGTTILFPSSGTGSWEAALQNCLDPGDRVLAASFGQFSHLWIDMCQRLKFEVQVLDTEWGEGAPVERYRDALAADRRHQIKAVLVTHNETATGVTSDVAAIRAALDSIDHPALLFVQLACQYRLPNGRLGVDICVAGSQKGLMLPAGLGITQSMS
jgi:alanine-glyoxylate transaminase/serine-glyoxylate transaminase/serine-pyruvate transaminase